MLDCVPRLVTMKFHLKISADSLTENQIVFNSRCSPKFACTIKNGRFKYVLHGVMQGFRIGVSG